MIQDARVLQPEFIPNEVAHRDAEVNLGILRRPLAKHSDVTSITSR